MITPPTRPQLPGDPDPLHVELQPVDERIPHHPVPLPPGPPYDVRGIDWFRVCILVAVVAACLLFWLGLWLLLAAPSSAPDPTAPPSGVSVAIGSVDAAARAQASASGPELSGAPQQASVNESRSDARLGGVPPSRIALEAASATAQPETVIDLSGITREGTLSYVSASYGSRYLALPWPRGTRATICGPAGCVTRISTDYGPDQRVNPDRIADLSAADWLVVSGVPLSYGLTVGTVTLEEQP